MKIQFDVRTKHSKKHKIVKIKRIKRKDTNLIENEKSYCILTRLPNTRDKKLSHGVAMIRNQGFYFIYKQSFFGYLEPRDFLCNWIPAGFGII